VSDGIPQDILRMFTYVAIILKIAPNKLNHLIYQTLQSITAYDQTSFLSSEPFVIYYSNKDNNLDQRGLALSHHFCYPS
jgi:hypothetical protein